MKTWTIIIRGANGITELNITPKELGKKLRDKAFALLEVIDDPTTDLWGGAGPDCRIKPVQASCTNP